MSFWRNLKLLSLVGLIVLVALVALLALMQSRPDAPPKLAPGRPSSDFNF